MRFERAGQASIFDLMQGYQPSRAANPSTGQDPVSLGLLPGGDNTSPPVTPLRIEALPFPVPDPSSFSAPTPEQPAEPPTHAVPPTDGLNFLTWHVRLKGRDFYLTPAARQAIMAEVMKCYEQNLRDELTSLRAELGLSSIAATGTAMRAPDPDFGHWPSSGVVSSMLFTPTEAQPEESGQPEGGDLQQVLTTTAKKRRVPRVPRSEAGAGTASPEARPEVPHSAASGSV